MVGVRCRAAATVFQVADLEAEVGRLRAGTSEILTGPGGAQVIIDDPSGNPIELFQTRR